METERKVGRYIIHEFLQKKNLDLKPKIHQKKNSLRVSTENLAHIWTLEETWIHGRVLNGFCHQTTIEQRHNRRQERFQLVFWNSSPIIFIDHLERGQSQIKLLNHRLFNPYFINSVPSLKLELMMVPHKYFGIIFRISRPLKRLQKNGQKLSEMRIKKYFFLH